MCTELHIGIQCSTNFIFVSDVHRTSHLYLMYTILHIYLYLMYTVLHLYSIFDKFHICIRYSTNFIFVCDVCRTSYLYLMYTELHICNRCSTNFLFVSDVREMNCALLHTIPSASLCKQLLPGIMCLKNDFDLPNKIYHNFKCYITGVNL